ncbi:MAG: hypothetical protein U0Q19_12880 [Kineosporiaceae bacterium]
MGDHEHPAPGDDAGEGHHAVRRGQHRRADGGAQIDPAVAW